MQKVNLKLSILWQVFINACLREVFIKKLGTSMVFFQTGRGGGSPGVMKKLYCFFEKVFLRENLESF